jgi:hypothetical protein
MLVWPRRLAATLFDELLVLFVHLGRYAIAMNLLE